MSDTPSTAPSNTDKQDTPLPANQPVVSSLNTTTTPPGKSHTGGKHISERTRNIISTLAIIIIAPAIALCLTAYVFQSYEVDGPSMQTTLQNNDRLIVYKLPKTIARLTGHPYIPHRGDIIVFAEKGLDSSDPSQSKQLIKRVIGLPGDRIVIQNNVVTIYNKQHPNGFDPDKVMPYGKVIPITSGNIDLTIPPNQVFVMGDNRTDSLDSRIFGTVPVQNIIGKLVVRVLPLDKAQTF